MNPSSYLPRPLPESLKDLAELALDLRWSWNHASDILWQAIDPEMWEASGNPWLILESVSQRRLEELTMDRRFCTELGEQVKARRDALALPTWYSRACSTTSRECVAYFSMEFGLGEALPIYSGGLGILAGDNLKAASDLGVPLVGIGLLYQQGYFRQAVDVSGGQLEYYPFNDPSMLPILPVRDKSGEWVRVGIDFPGRIVRLRAWQVQVGRALLYLLDSNDPQNLPNDRSLTGELYGGGTENRLQQEMALGIGGWRLLESLSGEFPVCHLNEGHAAFALLERARSFMKQTGLPFTAALWCTRAGNIFTTHTPVDAAFDRYSPELLNRYFRAYVESLGIDMSDFLALGRAHPEDGRESFNMAYLALHGSGRVNAVSRLHGEVSRRLFEPLFPRWPVREVPIGHVTNGIHVPSWESAAADELWTIACGSDRWHGDLKTLEQALRTVSDEALWAFRCLGRKTLVDRLQRRLARQVASRGLSGSDAGPAPASLDPNVLTMGFARRITSYKRPNLLLHDPDRLARLLNNPERPVQLIVSGKAHPLDDDGKESVRSWVQFSRRPDLNGRMVFVEDYDMALAQELVQGVDLWINTPRRPMEACGTSGMKVLVNGGLNLSELDGWWAEAYVPEAGWALGNGGEHDADPGWDGLEAGKLLDILEREVVPAYYSRNGAGIPVDWVCRMRESMSRLTLIFSTNRMLREYTENYYLPGMEAYRRRSLDGGTLGMQLDEWRQKLARHWSDVHFGEFQVESGPEGHTFHLQVYLRSLSPDMVQVELYAEPVGGESPRTVMLRHNPLAGAENGFTYNATVPPGRPPTDYTPRIIPSHEEASVPLEESHSLWLR